MPKQISSKLFGVSVTLHWLEDGFWYLNKTSNGHTFIRVAVSSNTRDPAFDHERLARSLSEASGQVCDPLCLPFEQMTLEDIACDFVAFHAKWRVNLDDYTCEHLGVSHEENKLTVSPKGDKGVFFRDHNLWVRDEQNDEKQLTFDANAEQPYAQWSINYQWDINDQWKNPYLVPSTRKAPAPDVAWSPYSSKFFTYQLDLRGVPRTYLLASASGEGLPQRYPQLHAYTTPFYDDGSMVTARLLVVNVSTNTITYVQTEPLLCLDMEPSQEGFGRMWWSKDNTKLLFYSSQSLLP
jgi:hypothetical protein